MKKQETSEATEKQTGSSNLVDGGEGKSQRSTDKPKRPLSAYNYFFQQERKKMKDSNETEESKEGKGFGSLTRAVAGKWKNLDRVEKEVFDRLAKQDKERYEKEIEEWKNFNNLNVAANAVQSVKPDMPAGNMAESLMRQALMFAAQRRLDEAAISQQKQESYLGGMSNIKHQEANKQQVYNTGVQENIQLHTALFRQLEESLGPDGIEFVIRTFKANQ